MYTRERAPRFIRVEPPAEKFPGLLQAMVQRVQRYLRRRKLLQQDGEGAVQLVPMQSDDAEQAVLDKLREAALTQRVAIGPRRGERVVMLATLPVQEEPPATPYLARAGGFSLHAVY